MHPSENHENEPIDRVVLRALRRDDAETIATLAADRDVTRYTSRMPHPYALADAQRFLDESRAASQPGTEEAFAVTADGAFSGIIAYEPLRLDIDLPDAANPTEVGYWLGKPFWGRGIATRAVMALIDRLRAEGTGRTLAATVFFENPASARVLGKAGFAEIGVATCQTPARDTDSVSTRLFIRAI